MNTFQFVSTVIKGVDGLGREIVLPARYCSRFLGFLLHSAFCMLLLKSAQTASKEETSVFSIHFDFPRSVPK